MADAAPDEIIESILLYALHIPPETFEAWRAPQTFAGSPFSSAWQALLVSSRWYYIGLPLLYEAAILRTQKQVTAFSEAVSKRRGDDGSMLGRYLRRLRMEAANCAAFNSILHACGSGIRVLYLSLDCTGDDEYEGFSNALQALDPSRLIISSVSMPLPWMPAWFMDFDSLQGLCNAIWAAAPTWTNLRRIDLSPGLDPSDMFVAQLATLPQVEYVGISFGQSCLEHDEPLSILDPILSSPKLKVLQFRDGVVALKHYPSASQWPHQYREKIFLGEGKSMVSLAEFPEFGKLTSSSSHLPATLPDDVWYRILGYATHVSGYNYLKMDASHVSERSLTTLVTTTRTNVLLVCKRFHRLGLPHMYSSPILGSVNFARFRDRIHQAPELAHHVRMLWHPPRTFPNPVRFPAPLLKLVSVDESVHVFPEVLKHVPPATVLALEWMQQTLDKERLTPKMFLALPRLRHLVLHGGCGGRLDEVPQVELPELETLRLFEPGIGLTKVFRIMNLPRLREFGFRPNETANAPACEFLKVHGAKLSVLSLDMLGVYGSFRQAIFDWCPNITELRLLGTVQRAPSSIPFLSRSQPHQNLRCLTFADLDLRHQSAQPNEVLAPFVRYLAEHKAAKLPVLDEFRIGAGFQWPLHESDYRVHTWEITRVALDLLAIGISLADGRTGARWARSEPVSETRPEPEYASSAGSSDIDTE